MILSIEQGVRMLANKVYVVASLFLHARQELGN